jgi:aryl-alcohol dehydrogenase
MTTSATAALWPDEYGPFRLQTVVLDDPHDDEVLVRIQACGICHTDSKARTRVALPAVFGHEGAGTVAAVGAAVTQVQPGDRVILTYPWCGACDHCRHHETFRCEHINALKFGGCRLDGSQPVSLNGRPVSSAFFQQSAFATYALTPARCLVPVDKTPPIERLAALSCGVQTGAGAVINTLKAVAGQALAIFGCGTVGLSAIMAARMIGVTPLVAVDRLESRLALARELGATHVIPAGGGDILEQLRDALPRGMDLSLDTTGAEDMMNHAVDCLDMGGQCGLVAVPPGTAEFHLFSVFSRAAVLHGVIQGSAESRVFLPQLLDWHEQGLFPYDRLITTYDFRDIDQAFADAASGKVVKPVLLMPE